MRLQNVIAFAAVCLSASLTASVLGAEPASPGPDPGRLEKMFRNLDKNSDGQIDLNEFVKHTPKARRQMRRGGSRLPEGDMRPPRRKEFEGRINELIERRVNEILDRRLDEIVEQRLSRMIEERLACPMGRGSMRGKGPMGPSRGRDRDWPGSFGRNLDRDDRPQGRGWACPPPGLGPQGQGFDRSPCDGRRSWRDQGRQSPRGRNAERLGRGFDPQHDSRGPQRGGRGQQRGTRRQHRPLFRMFDADKDGKIQPEEVDRLANELREKLGLQEGGAITLEDWDKLARERVEKWRKEKGGQRDRGRDRKRQRDRETE